MHQFAAHLGGELLPPRFAAPSATFLPSIRPRATTWGFSSSASAVIITLQEAPLEKWSEESSTTMSPHMTRAALHGSRQLTRPPKTCWHRLPRKAKGPRVTARPPSGSIRLGFPTERTPTWHAGAVDLSPTCTEPSSTGRDCRRERLRRGTASQRISRDSVTLRSIVSGRIRSSPPLIQDLSRPDSTSTDVDLSRTCPFLREPCLHPRAEKIGKLSATEEP